MHSSDGTRGSRGEKLRICPSCRMEISIFATKCRFCGDEVGRPKDESRQLSIEQLGGEVEPTDYAPGSHVLGALEAFRNEVEESSVVRPAKKSGIFRRKKSEPSAGGTVFNTSAVEDFEQKTDSLDSFGDVPFSSPLSSSRAGGSGAASPSWIKKVGFGAGIVCAVIILYFGSIKAAAKIKDMFWPQENVVVEAIQNNALGILNRGEVLAALQEAVIVHRKQASRENLRIRQIVTAKIAEQVVALIEADDWSVEKIGTASALAEKAYQICPIPQLEALKDEAFDENIAYRVILKEINTEKGTATFTINQAIGPSRDVVKKKEQAFYKARFEITDLESDYVKAEDTMRMGHHGLPRIVTFPLGRPPR